MTGQRHKTSPIDTQTGDHVGRSSVTIGAGVLLSRITGAARLLVGAAIFGRSVVGDLFVAINVLPLTLLAVFGGPAVTSVLVPPLVRLWETSAKRAEELVARVLGVSVLFLVGASVVLVLGRSLIAQLFVTAVEQDRDMALATASQLLAVMLPQIILYGMVAVLVSVQHARGRFAVASIAPAFENLVMIAVLWVLSDEIQGATSGGGVSEATIWKLGLGSTLAVLVHVGMQWFGAASDGTRISFAFRSNGADIGSLGQPVAGSLAWTIQTAVARIALLVAVGFVGVGGVQGFEIATLVSVLPWATVAYPIAAATLPKMATGEGSLRRLADATAASTIVASWILIPAGVGMIVFAWPLAEVATLGRFSDATSVQITAWALAGVGGASIMQSWYEIARQATMAAELYRSMNQSVAVAAVLTGIGLVSVVALSDGKVLSLAVGVVLTVATGGATAVIARPFLLQLDSGGWRRIRHHGIRILAMTAFASAAGVLAWFQLSRATESATLVLAGLGVAYVLAALAAGYLLTDRSATLRSLVDELNTHGSAST